MSSNVTSFDPSKMGDDPIYAQLLKDCGITDKKQSENIKTEIPENTSLSEAVIRLSKLSAIEYESAREEEAIKLKCRVSKLDEFVKQAISGNDSELKGRAIELYEPELWPDEVNGAEALTEAANHILKHMVISEADAYSCVLWAAHTHIFHIFDHTPRLLISAPLEECGKSLLMTNINGNFINKPLPVELMTPAPFFRLSEQYKPTFLIDEVDIFVRDNMDLLAAINNGWEPHGGVPRCVGEEQEVRIFSTHCPMAMAGIDIHTKLPKTTISRSVVILLERASLEEIKPKITYDKKIHQKAMRETGRKIARWCNDNKKAIRDWKPVLPDGVINRKAEKWSPLFAIAQVAGTEWGKNAIIALNGQADLSDPSKAEMLLSDMQKVIKPVENIFTGTLINDLSELEDPLWSEYNFKEFMDAKKRINSRQLANLLKKFGLKPKTLSIRGINKKGYLKKDIQKAFSKYLIPPPMSVLSVGTLQSPPDTGCSDSLSVGSKIQPTDRESLISPPDTGCYGPTDKTACRGTKGMKTVI